MAHRRGFGSLRPIRVKLNSAKHKTHNGMLVAAFLLISPPCRALLLTGVAASPSPVEFRHCYSPALTSSASVFGRAAQSPGTIWAPVFRGLRIILHIHTHTLAQCMSCENPPIIKRQFNCGERRKGGGTNIFCVAFRKGIYVHDTSGGETSLTEQAVLAHHACRYISRLATEPDSSRSF
jgi:hypothetical protein